ncbi:hypothetical protein [Roseinatronobacter bogoriensis]|uniref:Uncharacterized protein n=1 Tax=Roseinatronobacter bogoriensis subsp. barguzinensis TaxID=441209 RepID=A0A2K8KBV3_9RHOB|nr:hypothetical protein [Rhodobaca]ATX66929.1 hypothetical protein BG454_14770 [Rhodobaca barguzinensis]MBB4206412.1 hypothetical protein [Rhodobaca bogoriensis DSM 18756]TDW41156.1 hypothetical protein LY39_00255 [Rhodobaca barguzinensis]TDY74666.1 hypothetical protein EV660_101709 [Rhodobaca bogoriensis DSM 18756]
MKLFLASFTALFITLAVTLFVINVGAPWIWGAEEFSAFGTLLGGVAGPLALVFAVLQLTENKRSEIEGRAEERKARELGNIQAAIDLTTKRIDAILSKEDVNISTSQNKIILVSLEHLLGLTATSLPNNPVPSFSEMEKVAQDETPQDIAVFRSHLFERCAKLAILFNRLRHLCIVHDCGTISNIKCMTYSAEYDWPMKSLNLKGYQAQVWPRSVVEIQQVAESEAKNTS